MRSKLLIPSLVFAVLGVAACGSSSSSSSQTGSSSSSSTPASTTPATKKGHKRHSSGVPSRTYHVKLAGKAETPAGPPKGTGAAVIAIHGSSLKVCWRFAHLKGFTNPTAAHIHVGGMGTAGNVVVPLSTGAHFLHKGCVTASATLLKAIEKNPHGYYVNIHTTKYAGGAVRSQL